MASEQLQHADVVVGSGSQAEPAFEVAAEVGEGGRQVVVVGQAVADEEHAQRRTILGARGPRRGARGQEQQEGDEAARAGAQGSR